ncbi:MAG: tRNA pseudouridine(55) synthase TruB [Candidatus Nanopelagicales bacterium]
MARKNPPAPFDGLVVVDKPQEWTSHDVVGKLRRLIGTRRVGHAGTLDPMATGVLICGVGRATKLLGMVAASDKTYEATIRLGVSTTTDDAQGEVIKVQDAMQLGGAGMAAIESAIAGLSGQIMQRPSSVSAIKIDGQRAYKRVRDGEDVVLEARPVTVSEFAVLADRTVETDEYGDPTAVLDLDVRVTCSTGTYIRALARDLGDALGVGGHLTMLRRTRIGQYSLDSAHTLDELADSMTEIPLDVVCRELFVSWDLSAEQSSIYSHGGRLDWPLQLSVDAELAVFDPAGRLLGLAARKDGRLAPTVVWEPA